MYLGLDLGTSALKALLTDDKANIIKEESASYDIHYVNGNGTEQYPLDWIKALNSILIKLKDYLPQVKSLAISGQMHGLVILDEYDNVIRPCILWNDNRTVKENNLLNQDKELIYQETNNISYTGFTLAKLLWVYNNEKANFNKIAKIMLPKDYLIYYLTGIFVSDYTDMAGSLLLNVKDRTYSQKMLDLAHINIKQLPTLKESYEVAGLVKDNLKKEFGFVNTKVVLGGADNALAALATNTIEPGTCNISLGTSGTILMPVKEVINLNSYALHTFSHIKGSYVMGCILSAAFCRKWFLEDILNTNDYYADENLIQQADTKDLYFLPYLQGERSPHNDPLAKGAFIGLTSQTSRSNMSKAILEGVSFAIKDSYNIAIDAGIKINSLTLCGGGTKSKVWCQMIADIFNLEAKTLVNEQGPAYGAVLLSMIGDKAIAFEDINKFIKYDKTYLPNNVAYYDDKYKYFKKLYPALKKVFKKRD